jgi:hypothetical protein
VPRLAVRRWWTYHQRVLLSPALLTIGFVLALIMLLPARRLHLAGVSGRVIGVYAVCLWALAFFMAIRPLAARFLIPILIIAWVAPFIAAPERINSLVRRVRGPRDEPPRPPMKNVTPPDDPTPRG